MPDTVAEPDVGVSTRDRLVDRGEGDLDEFVTCYRPENRHDRVPTWSPDSTRLAFASNVLGPLYDIFMITVGEKGVRRVTLRGPDAFEPAWSPDGAQIAFSQNGAILTVDLERNTQELTNPDNNDSSPAWNPSPPTSG